MHRRDFLVASLALTLHPVCADDSAPADTEGPRYQLVTAASLKAQGELQFVANLRGRIGLIAQFRQGAPGPDAGVTGRLWRGQALAADAPATLRLDDLYAGRAYALQALAYDAQGRDPAVTLQDRAHDAITWRFARPKADWFRKYARINQIPFQLQAVEGPLAGHFLDFGEPEQVQLPDEGDTRGLSYLRRPALLVAEPSELSVLQRREIRER